MKRLLRAAAVFAAVLTIAFSCIEKENPEPDPESQANLKALKYLREDIMDRYYYWYTRIADVSYSPNTNIYTYFDNILYSGDRWSWMTDGQTYIADETGVIYGTYGANFAQPLDDFNDYNIYVRLVFPNSPFANAGVRRGYMLYAIDGLSVVDYWLSNQTHLDQLNGLLGAPEAGEAHLFDFMTPEGELMSRTIAATQSLETRPCLKAGIFTDKDYPGLTEPVGYFNYLGFKADEDINGKTMLDDITEPMAYFKENGVKTLIVDLRYNGGGDSQASDLLVSYLAPASALGRIYVKRTHNNKFKSLDKSMSVDSPRDVIARLKKEHITFSCEPDSPGFEHLYFITGKGSASASEMALNGLKPLADLKHVGGVTYGKPNGMYVFMYPNDARAQVSYNKNDYSRLQYVFLPICFYNENGRGQVIPDSGLVPDNIRPDDVYHDFGVEEDNIAACLYDIVNRSFPELPLKTKSAKVRTAPKLKLLLNKEDTDPNYGLYTVKPDFL